MQRNKAKYIIGSALFVVTSQSSVASAFQENDSQWLLIDERISENSDGFFSQILFADKNSLTSSDKDPMVFISNLNFRQEKIDGKFELMITDSRMKIRILCEERNYKLLAVEHYNKDNIKIETKTISQIGQWQQAKTPSYKALINFACNPKDADYQQTFGPNVLPLKGLIGYLNADWSK